MRILVTGGHGFIGTHLVRQLLEEGAAVRCLYRHTGTPAALAGLEVELARGDLRDATSLKSAVSGVDEIQHLAGLTSSLSPRRMHETNVAGTARLLEAAEAAGLPGRFVFCSSLSAAGPSPDGTPLDEGAPCKPLTWYGQSKRAAERLVLARADRLAVTILRPPGVYGPRDEAFLTLFQAAARGLAVLPGPPGRRYSLIHAEDLARALRASARSERTRGGIYFAAHPEIVTLEDIVAAAEAAVGRRARRLGLPDSFMRLFAEVTDLVSQWTGRSSVLGGQRMLEVATGDWVCRAAALERDSGWRAQLDLAEGFRQTAAWYRAEGLLGGTEARRIR